MFATLANKRTLLLLALASLANFASSQTPPQPSSNPVSVAEFDMAYWPPIAPVQFENREHSFLLDTGSTYTIFDNYFLKSMGKPVSTEKASTPGGQIEVAYFHPPAATLGKLDLSTDAKVSCMDMQGLAEYSGVGLRGLFGVSSLRSHVLQLDFDENRIRIFESDRAEHPDWGSAVDMPLTRQKVPCVEVEVEGVKAQLVVDTGSKSFMSLPSGVFGDAVGREPRKTVEIVINTMGGMKKEAVGRFKRVSVGGMVLENALVASEGPSGRLGYDFLRRYVVTMDFPNRRMYLKKGVHFDEPIEIDMSGLSIAQEKQLVVVKHVWDDQPAKAAGIKAQDIIAKIDGKNAATLPLEAIRAILQSGDGKTVLLTIRRQYDMLEIPLVLKRHI